MERKAHVGGGGGEGHDLVYFTPYRDGIYSLTWLQVYINTAGFWSLSAQVGQHILSYTGIWSCGVEQRFIVSGWMLGSTFLCSTIPNSSKFYIPLCFTFHLSFSGWVIFFGCNGGKSLISMHVKMIFTKILLQHHHNPYLAIHDLDSRFR